MLGFFARATTTDICVDAEEIASADWFTRTQLTEKLDSGELGLARTELHRISDDPGVAETAKRAL